MLAYVVVMVVHIFSIASWLGFSSRFKFSSSLWNFQSTTPRRGPAPVKEMQQCTLSKLAVNDQDRDQEVIIWSTPNVFGVRDLTSCLCF